MDHGLLWSTRQPAENVYMKLIKHTELVPVDIARRITASTTDS